LSTLTNLPVSFVPGVKSGTITLSPSSLVTEMGIVDPYWSNTSNWNCVIFNYSDETVQEGTSLRFNQPANTAVFKVSSTARQNTWQCINIIVYGFVDDRYVIPRSSFPNQSEFDISGGPLHLSFSVQPTNTKSGSTISPAIQVSVKDSLNVVYPMYSGSVTVAIGTNPDTGVLSGTLVQPVTNGIATFSNLSIVGVGNGYTLTAVAPSTTGATSSTFNITAKMIATGGTISTSGNYKIHTFNSSGTFQITQGSGTVYYLLVGGGGGGGSGSGNTFYGGGGGGGGELVSSTSLGVGSYGVTVGAGGSASSGQGNNGGNSAFQGSTAYGGGGGGSTTAAGSAGNGPSAGAGGSLGSNSVPGGGGQGNITNGSGQGGGGGGNAGTNWGGGGGGGGMNSTGQTLFVLHEGGNGGFSGITGLGGYGVVSSLCPGGGGGGQLVGGHGGGASTPFAGDGGTSTIAGTASTAPGGGGGGSGNGFSSGAGGPGEVILTYVFQ
jgi:hypothetical protein